MRWLSCGGLCLLLFFCHPAIGQEQQTAGLPEGEQKLELETDRDSFTPATSIVDRSLTLVEASYSFIDNRIGPEAHSFPELLVRYGATERLELRMGWNFEAGGPGTVSGGEVGGEDLTAEQEGRRTVAGFDDHGRAGLGLDVCQRLAVEFGVSLRHRRRQGRLPESMGALLRAQDSAQ